MRLLMFPGQGSQYSGMAKDWCDNFKEASLAFEEASDFSGLNLKKLCFDGTDADLKQTEVTQPAILTATAAIFRALKTLGPIKAQLFAGHSLGEYSALVNMGVLSLGEGAKLVKHRGRYMQEAVPAGTGTMAALVFKPGSERVTEKALELCAKASRESGKMVSVANFNSPEQIVIAGHTSAVEAAIAFATQEPIGARKAVPLPVSAPFHCELMKPAADRLWPELQETKFKTQAEARYIANTDALIYDLSEKTTGVAERLKNQITGSVLWVASVQKAIEAGCTEAVEIGPGSVLSGLVKRISVDEKKLDIKNIDRWEDYRGGDFKL